MTYAVLSTHVKLSQDLFRDIESLLVHARRLSLGLFCLPVLFDLSVGDLDGAFLEVIRVVTGASLDVDKFGFGLFFDGCISGCGLINDMGRHCVEQSIVFFGDFGVALSKSRLGDAVETLLAKRDGCLLTALCRDASFGRHDGCEGCRDSI